MALRTLVVATCVCVAAVATEVAARGPVPLVATALVEDVKSPTVDVEFMDYVGNGQVIKLGPADSIVLSYLKSCEHETITGGTVFVGLERSDVQGGSVARTKVPCDGGKMHLSAAQASQSAASAFRLQSAGVLQTVHASTPLFKLPRSLANGERELLIRRTDRQGEHYKLTIDDATASAGFYDLGKSDVSLSRGGTYAVTIGDHKLTLGVDANADISAKIGATSDRRTPIISRLARFQ